MLILMTADTAGGVWTFALELAEALAAYDVRVVLAALGGTPSGSQRADAARLPNLELLPSEFKLEWMNDPWDDVEESGRWLLDLEEEYAPDVIHLNSFGHGALPFRSPVVLTAHSCVLSWWDAVKREPAPARWRRYRAEVEMALQAVDLVTAPSRAMMNCLHENYAIASQSSRVVPNGRSGSRFRTARKESFVLTAGRVWDEAKNVAAVVEAAPRLEWPVHVAGEQRHPDGGRAELGMCRGLGCLSQTELADCYARAAIYALPARYEPFGLTALEAALSGCALVLGDIPSLREVWGDTAVFVAADNPGALAEATTGLIKDDARREEMARRAAARAQQYTADRMAARYLDVYYCARARWSQPCAS